MVHLSDLDWQRTGEEAIKDYKKGGTVKAVVTDVDVDKERISLSVKALGRSILGGDRWNEGGVVITILVTAMKAMVSVKI